MFKPNPQKVNYTLGKPGIIQNPKLFIHFGLYKLNEKHITGRNPGEGLYNLRIT